MRYKILLVEDSPVIQQMYKSKLLLEDFDVVTANNGMEAVKVLSKEKPDLILLDLMMPVMDGYKVLQVLKTDPKLSKIPALVFSAKGQPEEVERALSLGASGYFVKAITKPVEVIQKIHSILSQKPRVEESKSYMIEIKDDAYDAKKLSADFNLNDFKCIKCQHNLLLILVPDFSKETTFFSGKFFCPRCNK